MKSTTFLVVAAAATTLAVAALAHGGATGIIKQRMDAMSVMSDAVKSLTVMMRGEVPYDADAVSQGASIIKSHAGSVMTALFPPDSLDKPSVARPEIWADWDDFEALAMRLSVFADGLERAAGNGLMHQEGSTMGNQGMMGADSKSGADNMMGSMGSSMMSGGMGGQMPDTAQLAKMPADGVFNMLTRTCSACHTKFRIEKN